MSNCSPDCNDLGTITSLASCWPAGRHVILSAFNAIYNIRCKGTLCIRSVPSGTPTDEFMTSIRQPEPCDCPVLFIIEGCNIWAGGNLLGDECALRCGDGDTHYGPCQWHLLNQNPDDAIYGERTTVWVGEMFYQAGSLSVSINNLDPGQVYNLNTSANFDAILDSWDASFLLMIFGITFSGWFHGYKELVQSDRAYSESDYNFAEWVKQNTIHDSVFLTA